jgi:hypothetical protein
MSAAPVTAGLAEVCRLRFRAPVRHRERAGLVFAVRDAARASVT